MKSFFVIDVESIGLHGEGFAVAGGVYLENGAVQWEFCFSCPTEACDGALSDHQWVRENVPVLGVTHRGPRTLRTAFWEMWLTAKSKGAIMAAECLWPVEANFVRQCVADDPENRTWTGPYPFMEISSVMMAAGMDPMAKYERTASEMPPHDPLADARQSARLLTEALRKIEL